MNLLGVCKTWEWLKFREFNLMVDDERFVLGNPRHDGEVETGYVTESMWVDMPISKFLKLANATRIQGKLGVHEFQLKRSQIDAIKDYAARLGVNSETADKVALEKAVQDNRRREESAKIKAELLQLRKKALMAADKFTNTKPREKAFNEVMVKGIERIKERFNFTSQEILIILEESP